MKPLDAQVKAENRIVSDWLLYYPERLKEYQDAQEDVALYPGQALSDDIRVNGVSDPTARIAALREKAGKYDARWFEVIAEVERRIPEKQRIFLQIRREARHNYSNYRGRPGWVAYVQCKYPLVMAEKTGRDVMDFYISDRETLFGWWNRLVEYAARLAIKKGVL